MEPLADKIKRAVIIGLISPEFMERLRTNPLSAMESAGLALTESERQTVVRLQEEIRTVSVDTMGAFLNAKELGSLKVIVDWEELPWDRVRDEK